MEYILRFIIGGVVVSVFSVISDMLRPRTFSGLFGAAPTIALATLSIVYFTKSASKVATEGRSMLAGAVGLLVYALITRFLIKNQRLKALPAAIVAYLGWFAAAGLLWFGLLR